MQAFVPNTYPIGAINPCPAPRLASAFGFPTADRFAMPARSSCGGVCATGSPHRSSTRWPRRWTTPGSFSGASIDTTRWRRTGSTSRPDARSSFDQRHQIVATFEYTTGAGILGGSLIDGVKGRCSRTGRLQPAHNGQRHAAHAGFLLARRPHRHHRVVASSLTGVSPDPIADNSYANAAAFAVPPPANGATHRETRSRGRRSSR